MEDKIEISFKVIDKDGVEHATLRKQFNCNKESVNASTIADFFSCTKYESIQMFYYEKGRS